ncbi:LytTR family DNA-binding domain-containing protein [Polaribacter porphyrae]|uniref:HTH LytTR-type domain-containing protein n=1 Tax=Polaribacter porphyrae TaxID=1137780 RepID=A0A2S7WRQ9_9FLAO|nr:LytTR family DNA-binding domain-containing protein [Polaribacter porphyrae]PQJ80001.1 hypothetical protein BTO18_12840 [Polaribacter porphyrae]
MLNQPYPVHKNLKVHFLIAVFLSFWIFIFLFFAEPFKIDRFSTIKKLWALPIYGLIQCICYCIPLWYQKKVLKNNSYWKLKNEIFFFLLVSGLAIVLNYIFYRFFVTAHVNTYSFFEQVTIQLLPALSFVLPILILSRCVLGKLSENQDKTPKFILKGKAKNDFLKLNFQELLFIKSSDNYVEVYYLDFQEPSKKIIRVKLSDIEKQYPILLKTHRSYLINPIYFKSFENKNNKLFIMLNKGFSIPVSRSRVSKVKQELTF